MCVAVRWFCPKPQCVIVNNCTAPCGSYYLQIVDCEHICHLKHLGRDKMSAIMQTIFCKYFLVWKSSSDSNLTEICLQKFNLRPWFALCLVWVNEGRIHWCVCGTGPRLVNQLLLLRQWISYAKSFYCHFTEKNQSKSYVHVGRAICDYFWAPLHKICSNIWRNRRYKV